MPKYTLPKGTFSAKQLANYFSVSVTAIHNKIKEGKLPAKKVGSQWVITVDVARPIEFRNY